MKPRRIVAHIVALFAPLSALCVMAASAGGLSNWPVEVPLSPLPLGLSSLLPVPADNPLTRAKSDLGRRLFFDQRLSRDGSISCASCHDPVRHFTDGRALPVGIDAQKGRRNVPTLVNSAYREPLFWDGRSATLEEQALLPLTDPREMGHTLEAVVAWLASDDAYRAAFQRVFGSEQITPRQIAQALAGYQRTLVAANSPYDRYLWLNEESALSPAARRGLELFQGKARCAHCHEGPLFTDGQFHNTGVSWGIPPLDWGRFEHTGNEQDRGKFKTPTLRDVTLTAPYMHNGSLETLLDVVEFYNQGGRANPFLSPAIRPLELSEPEKASLVEFLQSLASQPSASRPQR
jgi:cytochrome c peroxidase